METLREVVANETRNLLDLNNLENSVSDRFRIISESIRTLNGLGFITYKGLAKECVTIRETIAKAIGIYYGISEIRYMPQD